MKESQHEPSVSPWLKTQYANLIRYKPSGVYYARLRVRGKLVWKSLKTDKVSVAVLRLADLQKQERQVVKKEQDVASGKVTFGDALSMWLTRLDGDVSLKPKTRIYYRERVKALKKSWPELESLDVRKITKADCLAWAAKYSKEQEPSPTAYNNSVLVLRKALDVAIEFGALYDNPARFISRARPRPKNPELPNREQFEKWVDSMDKLGDGWCRASADLVRFLAYGGMRKGEASNVLWRDVDFDRGTIHVRGDAETATKNSETRQVPIIPEMASLLERLRSESGALPESPVMRVGECQGNMDRAAKAIGMKRITHHDLRHLFATRCIESGVDIPTVSRWLGHKDGGALAMKVYGHLQDAHSAQMAKRVSFAKPAAENVVPMAKEEAV